MLPKLKLTALSTGGGWGLGDQFARLPAAEQQVAAKASVYKVTPVTGRERSRASENASDGGGSASGSAVVENSSQLESSGGGFGPGRDTDSVTEDTAPIPPPTKTTVDDDDCTFVDNGSVSPPTPTPLPISAPPVSSTLVTESETNPFTLDGSRWRAGFMVSSLDIPSQLPIRAMVLVGGKYLWAAVADEPVCMYDLSGCDLNPQRSVDTVCDATAMAAVRVMATLTLRGSASSSQGRGVGGGGCRGGIAKTGGAIAFRGGRGLASGVPTPRGGAAAMDFKRAPPREELVSSESLTLWCGVTVPGDDRDHPRGCIALFDLDLHKDDGMISNAHGAPITYLAALPEGTSTGSRVWSSAADGPGGGGTLKVWDGATRKTITRKSLAGPVVDQCTMPPAVCPHVWTACLGEASIRVWDYEGRERSSARFPPNSNALKFKTEVRTLRDHPHNQLVWVCLNGSTVLVNPKTYDVIQSLPITAVSLEFSTTNPHTAVVIGKLLESNQPDVLRVLLIDVPISSGRTGGDATFVFSTEAVVQGQKLPKFALRPTSQLSLNTPRLQLFADVPLMVLISSEDPACHKMGVFTTEDCNPIENWEAGGASTEGAQRRVALQREQQERYRRISLAKKQAAAQQGPKGLVLGVASNTSSSQQASTNLGGGKAAPSNFTRHGDEPDYESTENTMVVHSAVGVSGPLPFLSNSKPTPVARVSSSPPPPTPAPKHTSRGDDSASIAALLENVKQLVSSGYGGHSVDPALSGLSLGELTASRTLQDVVDATRDLRRLRSNDSQQQDMLQLYQFAQTQRFGMSSTLGGAGLDAACRAARESRIPSLLSQEGRAVGEVLALMAVELEMWRKQARQKQTPIVGQMDAYPSVVDGSITDSGLCGLSNSDARTSSLLRLNADLRAKVASCEAGLIKLQGSLEGATVALLGPGQIDTSSPSRMRLERDMLVIGTTSATLPARFTSACSALSCLVWEAGRSKVGPRSASVSIVETVGSPHDRAATRTGSISNSSALAPDQAPRTFGGVLPAKERDVTWLMKSVLRPTLASVQQTVQLLSKGRSILKESLRLCVQEGIMPVVDRFMSASQPLSSPLSGMGSAFISLDWDTTRLFSASSPRTTQDLMETATHVVLLGTTITSQPLFADVTYAAHMMRLCEQETLVVALDRALAVCEGAGEDCGDGGGQLVADLGTLASALGLSSDELDPVGKAYRADMGVRQEVLRPLVTRFESIHSKSFSPRLSSSTPRLTASVRGGSTSSATALLGGYVGLIAEFDGDGGRQLADGLLQWGLEGHLSWCHVYFRFVGEGLLFVSRFLRAHQVIQWTQRQQAASSSQPPPWADTVIPLSNDNLVFIADQLNGWKRCVSELETQLLRPLQTAFKSHTVSDDSSVPSRSQKMYALYLSGGSDSTSTLDNTSEDVEHLLIKYAEVVRLLEVFLGALQEIGRDATVRGIDTVLLMSNGDEWSIRALPSVERYAVAVLDALPFIASQHD